VRKRAGGRGAGGARRLLFSFLVFAKEYLVRAVSLKHELKAEVFPRWI